MPSEHEHRDYFDFGAEPPPPETPDVERPEGEDDPALLEPVLDALRTVRDPEIPVNIVELGLIYELVVKQGGIVFVEMTEDAGLDQMTLRPASGTTRRENPENSK